MIDWLEAHRGWFISLAAVIIIACGVAAAAKTIQDMNSHQVPSGPQPGPPAARSTIAKAPAATVTSYPTPSGRSPDLARAARAATIVPPPPASGPGTVTPESSRRPSPSLSGPSAASSASPAPTPSASPQPSSLGPSPTQASSGPAPSTTSPPATSAPATPPTSASGGSPT